MTRSHGQRWERPVLGIKVPMNIALPFSSAGPTQGSNPGHPSVSEHSHACPSGYSRLERTHRLLQVRGPRTRKRESNPQGGLARVWGTGRTAESALVPAAAQTQQSWGPSAQRAEHCRESPPLEAPLRAALASVLPRWAVLSRRPHPAPLSALPRWAWGALAGDSHCLTESWDPMSPNQAH